MFYFCPFESEILPTFLVKIVNFPSLSKFSLVARSFPQLLSIATISTAACPATFRAETVHFQIPSIAYPCAFFSTTSIPFPWFQSLFALLHKFCIAALLTQIDCVGFSTFFNHHRRNLPPDDSFFTASIVSPINGSPWFAESTRHNVLFLCFFLANCQCVTNIVWSFFWFYPNHFPFWAFFLSFSTLSLCYWAARRAPSRSPAWVL